MSSIENLAYSIGLQAYIYGYPLLVIKGRNQIGYQFQKETSI